MKVSIGKQLQDIKFTVGDSTLTLEKYYVNDSLPKLKLNDNGVVSNYDEYINSDTKLSELIKKAIKGSLNILYSEVYYDRERYVYLSERGLPLSYIGELPKYKEVVCTEITGDEPTLYIIRTNGYVEQLSLSKYQELVYHNIAHECPISRKLLS